jgi:hypothetical protein
MSKGRRHSGIPIASGQDLGAGPRFGAKTGERLPVLFRNAARQKNSSPADLPGEFPKDGMQPVRTR